MQRSGQAADREKIQEAGRVKEAGSKRSDEDKHTEKPLRDLHSDKTILGNERERTSKAYIECVISAISAMSDQCNQLCD